jgi:diacylglycerol kinase
MKPAIDDERPATTSDQRGLANAFGFAFAGLAYLFRTQRNARIHALFAAAAIAVGAWLRIPLVSWAILVLTIVLVIVLEGLNTAIEAVVDLASPQYSELAKIAKDVAAAMVLLAAMGAVIIGLLILGPPLCARLFHAI